LGVVWHQQRRVYASAVLTQQSPTSSTYFFEWFATHSITCILRILVFQIWAASDDGIYPDSAPTDVDVPFCEVLAVQVPAWPRKLLANYAVVSAQCSLLTLPRLSARFILHSRFLSLNALKFYTVPLTIITLFIHMAWLQFKLSCIKGTKL